MQKSCRKTIFRKLLEKRFDTVVQLLETLSKILQMSAIDFKKFLGNFGKVFFKFEEKFHEMFGKNLDFPRPKNIT